MARITRDESSSVVGDDLVGPEVVIANIVAPMPVATKLERPRHAERKHGMPRWAQTLVACAATAAAAVLLVRVTPSNTDRVSIMYSSGGDLDVGAEPVCNMENASDSAEILASLPPLA
ncbi:MAG TPA: hypothetical protein PK156_11030 [Polyangium sp.]|nr:hypothetical protein [Polyangium sp.]